VGLLIEAIANDKRILVVGDFDCDGATACAVGVRGLRMLGAQHVFHAVPNRMVHGYGLSPSLVEELAELQPDLLVTVDHGIACHAGVIAAKARAGRCWSPTITYPGRSCRRPMSSSIPISTVMPSPASRWPASA
jgi:single-stranded-DNA-specific exonuclease